jgi:hypothetical protein
VVSAAAFEYVGVHGWRLWYGDALAHLNTARRILDAREPGYEQIGTVWLVLPHLLMMPWVGNNAHWRSGAAGAVPAAACFVAGGLLLFLGVRRLFGSEAAAWAAVAVYAVNPNLLYLQSAPMTEPMALCWWLGLFWSLVRLRESGHWRDALLAAVFALCGTLTRYEFWFVLPFVAVLITLLSGKARWRNALLFCAVAGLGPLYWIAHNWILYSNPLEFYNGPWSAKMINARDIARGTKPYPCDHNWGNSVKYLWEAARLCLGRMLLWAGVAGAAAAVIKRGWAAAVLFALIPAFYVLSMYSSGTPVSVPTLWPNSYYNTRYGLNLLPLACLGVAGWVALSPRRWRGWAAVVLVAACLAPWVLHPGRENWVCWKESQVNSQARRAWTHAAAEYLAPRYKTGAGIFMSFGDLTGILVEAGIPLKESFHEVERPPWLAAAARPDLFLREEWAIAFSGDAVSQAMNKMRRGPRRYECVRMFAAKGAPVVEIWRHIQ